MDEQLQPEKNIQQRTKNYPNLSIIILILSISLVCISIGLIFLNDFIKISLSLFFVSLMLIILSYNLIHFFNLFYIFAIFTLTIYSLVATYAFENTDLLYQTPIIIFIYNLILFLGKYFDNKKISNKLNNIFSYSLITLLIISNIILISLWNYISNIYLILSLMLLTLIFLIYNFIYINVFIKKIINKDNKKSLD